ncbi:hypothetical protein BDV37DRAFT_261603 [Aspergillus pseudonomiae]|uniref:Uncharacterized protein n=1 Tax=Aspergillus pseudonomiae TaxID=1506151 RepID=A0A5N7CZA4_9EURO|nr:uncharacterized protein BDV37DRAFT_261603 [Aspergillus pseudonomiae]KAE8399137.1 hypothetical protein BDV37DRAFT_261603 [Aspergillus pseudonomiae]
MPNDSTVAVHVSKDIVDPTRPHWRRVKLDKATSCWLTFAGTLHSGSIVYGVVGCMYALGTLDRDDCGRGLYY